MTGRSPLRWIQWHLILMLAFMTVPAVHAMRQQQITALMQRASDMFFHGFDGYMQYAYPEDELRPIQCSPLTRDNADPSNIGLNDVLGNYSLTLIDSLSTLAILASAPDDEQNTAAKALQGFQDAVAALVKQYGDGSPGRSGRGLRGRGFDVDSKVQVFETVIRGVGGLLSAHLFAIGELPIHGYDAGNASIPTGGDPLYLTAVGWPNGLNYNGQLLRLALDLGKRLLPAFYTTTGLPYPRVNLRHGIPFYANSPLHKLLGHSNYTMNGPLEITETCSAGAGSLVLEFTVLSRLSSDSRFENLAKRAFWAVWDRRSEIGLIGAGLDAESGRWVGGHAVVGAGADSFFEYALKTSILLSGQPLPSSNASRISASHKHHPDPNLLFPPLSEEQHAPASFLNAWQQAHTAIRRHMYDDAGHPHYINVNLWTGSLASQWVDSLGAYYAGLLVLAGEIEEAIATNLLYAAIWAKFSAVPERWSTSDHQVEGGLGWWPLRPEFIESTYHLYQATKDPFYLYVGEMVLRDIDRQCRQECGFAGIQNVETGELTDRMESFFLSETTKYAYLLFDQDHPLNMLDKPFVFTTEGHPLILPQPNTGSSPAAHSYEAQQSAQTGLPHHEASRSCPAASQWSTFAGSAALSRTDLFHPAKMLDLHLAPQSEKLGQGQPADDASAYLAYPWTMPTFMLPANGTCSLPSEPAEYYLEFALQPQENIPRGNIFFQNLARLNPEQVRVLRLSGLKLSMRVDTRYGAPELRVVKVNGLPLGRDEVVLLDRALLTDILDPKFKLIKDLTSVKLHQLHEIDLLHASNDTSEAMVSPSDNSAQMVDDVVVELAVDAHGTDQSADVAAELGAVLKQWWAQVQQPMNVESQALDHQAVTGAKTGPFNLILNLTAVTPVGVGAAPLPAKDIPPGVNIPGFGPVPDALLPWSRTFVAGNACDQVLPEEGPRDHHIILIRRGGCSFSQKIANIPAFKPSLQSLQLVIIVSDDEVDSSIDDRIGADGKFIVPPLVRPHLVDEQRTPGGIQRRHPIPMIMTGGGNAAYEQLASATKMGITRRFWVESEGRRISNIIIDDGDTTTL